MKRFSLIISLVYFASQFPWAQYGEVGGFVGGSHYFGDIQGEMFEPNEWNLAIGLIGRYNFNKRISFQGSIIQGRISGNDTNASRIADQARNLSFRADI